MADVDISIGARDEASAILKGVREEIAKMGSTIESEAGRMDAATESLEISFGGVAVAGAVLAGVYAGFTGVRRAIDFAWEASEAYKVQEDASVGLTAALGRQLATTRQLANQGSRDFAQDIKTAADTESQALREIVEGHEAYARSLQRMTGVGDEVILGIEQQAVMLGVQESQLDMVAKATLGISKATGLGYKTALRKVNETITGNTDALADYLPALKQTEDATHQIALVNELAMQGLNQHKNALNTLSGSQDAANAAMTDLRELVGSLIAPFRVVINQGVLAWATAMHDAFNPAMKDANDEIKGFGEWTEWATAIGVAAAATLKVAWKRWFDFQELGFLKLELYWEQFKSGANNAIDNTIQGAKWFRDNFDNIITNVLRLAINHWDDYFKTVGGFYRESWDWITSGFEGGLEGLNQRMAKLTVEFMNSISKTEFEPIDPFEPIARDVSKHEKDLKERIKSLQSSLGADLANTFTEMMNAFRKSVNGADLKVDLNAGGIDDLKNASKELQDLKQLQATEARLLTRGPSTNPMDELLATQKKAAKSLEKIEKSANALGPTRQPLELKVQEVHI